MPTDDVGASSGHPNGDRMNRPDSMAACGRDRRATGCALSPGLAISRCFAILGALVAASCGPDPVDGLARTAAPSEISVAPAVIPPHRPNVVILVMDTTRADRCSAFGYERPTTPALEAIAAEGVAFEAAWAPSSWTLPTHASILTGLLPERHGATISDVGTLVRGHTTLAEHLRDAGYETAAFSNNPWVSEEFGLSQGFSTFVPLHKERSLSYPTARPTHAQALEWIRERRDPARPFFLLINDLEPHAPYAPPPEEAERFVRTAVARSDVAEAMSFQFPETVMAMVSGELPDQTRLALLSDLYDAEIATLDREIGRFVAALRRDGILDDTLLIITGDHGEHFGENGLLEHSLSLGRPLLHVPLIIRHPEHFSGGRHVFDVVRSEDIFPTVMEVCGVEAPDDIDGRSLLHDLPGRLAIGYLGRPSGVIGAVGQARSDVDMSRYDVTLRSVFDGQFQLIRTLPGDVDRLYDTQADPRGEVDVAADHPAVLTRLRAALPE